MRCDFESLAKKLENRALREKKHEKIECKAMNERKCDEDRKIKNR